MIILQRSELKVNIIKEYKSCFEISKNKKMKKSKKRVDKLK